MSRKEISRVTQEYIEKYAGELSKKMISELMHDERPDLYKTAEYARSSVRFFTGNQGKKSRRHIETNKRFFSAYPEPMPEDYFYDITEEKAKILLLSDIHVPFQDKEALDIAVNYGVKKNSNIIILNGDTFDHYSESRHEKDYRKRDPIEDYEQYQDFLFELRCAFPDARIIMKLGNHELWWEKWFIRNGMGKFLEVPHFQYDKIMKLEEHNIQLVPDYATITIAGLNVIHGHEYKGGGGGVNPARWLSLRAGESTICGHFHRSSEHTERTHRGDIISYWTTGHLAQQRPRYMPYNRWNHGFAFIIKEGRYYHVKNKRIHKGLVL